MKTLQDFQKRSYSIARTVIGQHTQLITLFCQQKSSRIKNLNVDNRRDTKDAEQPAADDGDNTDNFLLK